MKRVFASQDQAALAIVRELVANEGIGTTIQNEKMSTVSGEVPFTLALPEVWVVRDEDEVRALAIVEAFNSGEARDQQCKESWNCPHCGETIEKQFTSCCKCGTTRPAAH